MQSIHNSDRLHLHGPQRSPNKEAEFRGFAEDGEMKGVAEAATYNGGFAVPSRRLDRAARNQERPAPSEDRPRLSRDGDGFQNEDSPRTATSPPPPAGNPQTFGGRRCRRNGDHMNASPETARIEGVAEDGDGR